MKDIKIYILGSGGFAKELQSYFSDYYEVSNNAFNILKQNVYLVDDNGGNLDIKTYQEYVSRSPSTSFSIMGAGNCKIKSKMLNEIRGSLISLRHPKATILTQNIGVGVTMAPGCVVAPYSSLGDHVLINYNSTIGHDAKIGDLSVISPNASIGGNCVLHEQVYVGANASIKEYITIGKGATVGMGSVVIRDVRPGTTVVGNPAREI